MIPSEHWYRARADLEFVAGKWGELKNRLRKTGGDPNAPRVGGSKEPALEVDLYVSDLMHEITQHAVFLGRVLIEETDWRQEHGEMPGLLMDVASQYGHFVTDEDEKVAWDFVDQAAEFRRKVEGVLAPRAPRRYVGPCFHEDCQAELYITDGIEGGVCAQCMTPWTLESQMRSTNADLRTLLMEKGEITIALKILGYEVRTNLVHEWATPKGKREARLKEQEPGLYRLFDAVKLIQNKGKRGARPKALVT